MCHDQALVQSRTAGWARARLRAALDHLSGLDPGMPDFAGTAAEKENLADYLVSLQGDSQ
jgi:hypothetical protein